MDSEYSDARLKKQVIKISYYDMDANTDIELLCSNSNPDEPPAHVWWRKLRYSDWTVMTIPIPTLLPVLLSSPISTE